MSTNGDSIQPHSDDAVPETINRVLESTTTEETEYYYASGKLLRQVITTTTTTAGGEPNTTTDTLDFFYDASGQPYAVKYNDNLFYYVLNLQGDVVRIVNSSGTSYGIYNYDAWGNILYHTDNALLNANPLRYRGYVYDQETELYYLQSRYYDPQVGRFINADKHPSTGQGLLGNNMFAYCNNNPVIAADHNGEWLNIVIGAGIGALAGLVGQVISDVITSVITQTPTVSNWQTYAGAAIGGAAGGVVLATTGNVNAANAVTGFATTGAAQTLEKITGVNDRSWEEIGTNSARDGAVSLALGSFLSGIPNVTTGKNSMMAVYQSGLTKLRNDVAKTMSTSVMTKGFIASVAGGLYLDGYYGLKQASSAN